MDELSENEAVDLPKAITRGRRSLYTVQYGRRVRGRIKNRYRSVGRAAKKLLPPSINDRSFYLHEKINLHGKIRGIKQYVDKEWIVPQKSKCVSRHGQEESLLLPPGYMYTVQYVG